MLFFQDSRGKSHRAARILDHIMLKRPDEDFEKFCEALRSTGQGHVVDRLLTPGGRDRTDLADLRLTSLTEMDETELRQLMVPNWRELIVYKRNEIVDELEATDDILNDLVKHGVMNICVCEVLKVRLDVSLGLFITFMAKLMGLRCR